VSTWVRCSAAGCLSGIAGILKAIGRLRPGVTVAQASAEVSAITDALWKEHPTDFSTGGAVVIRFMSSA